MTNRVLLFSLPFAFLLGLGVSQLPAQDGEPAPAGDEAALKKTRGYAMGVYLGRGRAQLAEFIDAGEAGRGFADGLRGQLSISEDELDKQLFELRVAMIKKQVPKQHQERAIRQAKSEMEKMQAGRKAKGVGEKWLADNAKKEGVKTTDSGLQYKVLKEGTGPQPTAADTVTVHYVGKLIDGKEFDSSVKRGQPATFPLGNVVKGWTEGLQLMKVGGKYELYIPYELAYGPQGRPPTIPPYATLVFEIELLSIEGKK